jgi:hypothetical protein
MRDTFGNTKAVKLLEKEMENLPKKTLAKISFLLERYFLGLKELKKIEDKRTRVYMSEMWRREYISKNLFDGRIGSLVKNLIVTKHKEFLKGE